MRMNSIGQHFYRILTGFWSWHQRELDHRDERIADLEMLIVNQQYEIDQLKSQLDQYQSIFSIRSSEQRRSGVSAPPSIVCTLIMWQKSTW